MYLCMYLCMYVCMNVCMNDVLIEEQKQEVQKAKDTEKSARERLKDVQQKMKVCFYVQDSVAHEFGVSRAPDKKIMAKLK